MMKKVQRSFGFAKMPKPPRTDTPLSEIHLEYMASLANPQVLSQNDQLRRMKYMVDKEIKAMLQPDSEVKSAQANNPNNGEIKSDANRPDETEKTRPIIVPFVPLQKVRVLDETEKTRPIIVPFVPLQKVRVLDETEKTRPIIVPFVPFVKVRVSKAMEVLVASAKDRKSIEKKINKCNQEIKEIDDELLNEVHRFKYDSLFAFLEIGKTSLNKENQNLEASVRYVNQKVENEKRKNEMLLTDRKMGKKKEVETIKMEVEESQTPLDLLRNSLNTIYSQSN